MPENNYTEVKENLLVEIDRALDRILEEGFGQITIIIDENREIYDIIPSPRIRVKS